MTDFARSRRVDIKTSQEPLELLAKKNSFGEIRYRKIRCDGSPLGPPGAPSPGNCISLGVKLIALYLAISFPCFIGSAGKLCLIFSKAQKTFHTFARAAGRQVKECRL